MKLVFDGHEKYPNVRVIEVEQADLKHNLTILGYEEYEEELQTFRVNEKSHHFCGRRNSNRSVQ